MLKLYQITKHRINTISNKIINDSKILDNRGCSVGTNKINDNVWIQLNSFFKQFPTKSSHYKSNHNKLIFINSDLNCKKLFNLFKSHYYETNSVNLKLCYQSLLTYFNTYCNYKFKSYQIDCCNFCTINSENVNDI